MGGYKGTVSSGYNRAAHPWSHLLPTLFPELSTSTVLLLWVKAACHQSRARTKDKATELLLGASDWFESCLHQMRSV